LFIAKIKEFPLPIYAFIIKSFGKRAGVDSKKIPPTEAVTEPLLGGYKFYLSKF